VLAQQDVAEAVDPADKAAAEPAGAAAAPDAPGHRQAPRGRPGGHRPDQGGAHHPGGEHDGRAGDPRALLRAHCRAPAHHRDPKGVSY